MKILPRQAICVLILSLLVLPAWAQEDESGGDDEGWGKLLFEYGVWIAQPTGTTAAVTTIDAGPDPFSTTIIGLEPGTDSEDYTRVGAEFGRNVGRVTFTWYAHRGVAERHFREPGNFIFGELLAYPAFAGYANDGYADAVDAVSSRALRDQKLEFSRVAFSNSRLAGRWVAGIRRVSFDQQIEATYHALVPDLPPVAPTLPAELLPVADTAELNSRFDGRGLSGGMEFRAPIAGEKFVIEAAINVAVLVGDVDSSYRSVNHAYVVGSDIQDAPYTDFTDASQIALGYGIQGDSRATTSEVLEVSLGGRWTPLAFMDVFLGFRAVHYGNIALELRSNNIAVVGSTVNLLDADETPRAVSYEGFYAGVGFRF